MSGKRPWDDLRFPVEEDSFVAAPEAEEDRSVEIDVKNIAKHALFGATIGGLTGLGVSSIELLRDPRAMAAGKRALATQKMTTQTGHFGLFFAGFHGIRKTLQLYAPQTSSDKTTDFLQLSGIAGAIAITPIIVVPRMRFMTPYCVFLCAIDAVNSLTSG
jgi:hypothetical protein